MLFSVEHRVVPRAPTDALQLWGVRGCARGAYFAIEIYMSLYYLITAVSKIIVFLKIILFLSTSANNGSSNNMALQDCL